MVLMTVIPPEAAHALAETISYPATGGRIRYHTSTNLVVACDDEVTSAYLPQFLNVRESNVVYSLPVEGLGRYNGQSAFAEKKRLTSVAMETGPAAFAPQSFYNASNLEGISIPGSVKEISQAAFQGCTALREVTIHDGTQNIWMNAFGGCINLERAYFLSRDCIIDPTAFHGVKKEKFVMYGYEGSTAEAFAKENNISFQNITGETDRFMVNTDGVLTEVHGGESIVEIPAEVGGVRVTGIADGLFENSKAIQKVILPDSITTIGDRAFSGCTELKYLELPGALATVGDRAFEGCVNLNNVTLPEQLVTIGMLAFAGCTGLTDIRIPSSVREVGTGAFSRCSGLTLLILEEGLPTISNGMLNGCSRLTEVLVPNSVKTIDFNAFAGCSSLRKVTIPSAEAELADAGVFQNCHKDLTVYCVENSQVYETVLLADPPIQAVLIAGANEKDFTVDAETGLITGYRGAGGRVAFPKMVQGIAVTGIAAGALKDNATVTEMSLGDHIKSIGTGAFENCSALLRLAWPEHLPAIPDAAFAGCKNLIYIALPDTLTGIGARSFEGCVRLPEVRLPASLREIGNRAFAMTAPEAENILTSLAGISLPEGLTKLGDYAFENCKIFTQITIPASVNYLGAGVFQGCTNLETAVWNGSLNRIPAELFKDCSHLDTLTLPQGIIEIGDRAFSGCQSLQAIELSAQLQRIGEEAFYHCTALNIERFPDGLTALGEGVFARSGLGAVLLPEGLMTIPARAFADCNGLILTVPGMNTSIDAAAFEGAKPTVKCYLDSETWRQAAALGEDIVCVALDLPAPPEEGFQISAAGLILGYTGDLPETLEIPATVDGQPVTGIGSYAFYGQTGLKHVILPEGAALVGSYAFAGCTGLAQLTLPESLTSIHEEAFAECGFGRLELKNHIVQIEERAFRACAGLVIVCSADSAAFGYARSSGVPCEAAEVDLDVSVGEDGKTYTVNNQFADREIILVFGAYTEGGDLLEYQFGKVASGTSCTFNAYNLRVADYVKVFAWDRMDTIRPVAAMYVRGLGEENAEE